MSLKNQNSNSSIPSLILAILVVALAIGGAVMGLNVWLMVGAAVLGLLLVLFFAMRHDLARYLRMRSM